MLAIVKIRFLLALLCVVHQCSASWSTSSGYIKSSLISETNWNSAIQTTLTSVKTLYDCAQQCKEYDLIVSQDCNAFDFDGTSCVLAHITTLEEAQDGVTSKEFHIDNEVAKTLPVDCHGGEHCCNADNPCAQYLGLGDCNEDSDCAGTGMICGTDNCLTIGVSGRVAGGLWDATDDCCVRKCRAEHPCSQGEGQCSYDVDCGDVTKMKCEADSCLNRNYFPLRLYPHNTASKYSATDDCCRRRCYPHEPCSDGQKGCDTDADCEKGLECNSDNTCVDIDECSTTIGTSYCGAKADCTNSVGTFSCACQAGYEKFTPQMGCSDIDECFAGTHTCQKATTCTNTDGSFTCTCWDGYEGDPLVNCVDINDCETGGKYGCTFSDPQTSGTRDMSCTNWPGSNYECADTAIMSAGGTKRFFVIMGLDRNNPKESLVRCNNHKLPEMPDARNYHRMVYVNDYIYTCGGRRTDIDDVTKTCYKLNLVTKIWEHTPNMLRHRRQFSLDHVEGKIYAIGGFNDYNNNLPETGTHCERTAEAFDLKSKTWNSVQDHNNAAGPGIRLHCSAVHLYKIFILGGLSCDAAVDTSWVFDTRANNWYTITKLPFATYHHTCLVTYMDDGRQAIVVGGFVSNPNRNKVYLLDLANENGNWDPMPDLAASSLYTPQLLDIGKVLMMWAGHDGGWTPQSVQVMDFSGNTWTKIMMDPMSATNEAYNAAAVISSKYFDADIDCYNVRWPTCVDTANNYPLSDLSGMPLTGTDYDSNEKCADKCAETSGCKFWYRQEGNECYLKSADTMTPTPASYALGAGKISDCFYRWKGDTTVLKP